MSLWYESLGQGLYDCEENSEQRAKCILEHLSMGVPRSWWERALEEKTVHESHVDLLHDLYEELQKAPGMADWNFDLLVALAFVDPQSGAPIHERTIEEYLNKASEILTDHPELERLGDAIQNRSLQLAGRRSGQMSLFE